jgi:hypothetical protein
MAQAADGLGAAPDTAGIANAFAAAVPERKAGDSEIFHGLFTDSARTSPVAPVVHALWRVPQAASAAPAASAGKSAADLGLHLFADPADAETAS